jgi:hypothetical protein
LTWWDFDEATCFGDLPCLDELLETCDRELASLTPIGKSTNADIAAITVRRRDQNPARTPPGTPIES